MSKIEVQNISKTFGNVTAIKNVTVTFEGGHIYGLLGRNGAGKSTLLNMITGKMHPTNGGIMIDGEPAWENDRALSKIYCMTELTLYPERMKVRDAFRWSSEFYENFDMNYALALCEKFELKTDRKIKNLSTGYSSIFKIIVALSCGTEIVLFDEPVLGLDANHRDIFYKELLKNFSDNPRVFILSTHLIEEVASIIDRVVIIKEGEVLMDNDVESIIRMGYSVSGSAAEVDEYTKGRKVLGFDTLGNYKSAYLLGNPDHVPQNLETGKLELQKLFIQLTNAQEGL
jgi:ABC-2 type transport system ATP-binding protein